MQPFIHKSVQLIIILVMIFTGCKDEKRKSEIREPSPNVTSQPPKFSDLYKEDALREAALNGQVEVVKELISGGVNVDAQDQDGRSALMLSAFNGHTEIVELLLDKGSDVHLRDNIGRTPLLYASTGPFPETVKLLLERDSDPNIEDYQEHYTPLMHASAEGHLEVVKVLLENHADPSLKDVDGDKAESFARQNGHVEVAEFLKAYGK